jgi:hydroxyethylthiazole kinase-like uncharacterized protein yjeF
MVSLNEIYKKRDPWSHKGQFGRLVVIAGSKRHTGSACFVGMAAYRAGCDLVYVVSPERAADVAANYSPNLITEPLFGDRLSKEHVEKIVSMIKEVRATALAIGPGLGREKVTLEAILDLILLVNIPMVIDADAIRAVANGKYVLKGKNAVLTPHADEFRELTGISVKNLEERKKFVTEEANKLNEVILLKGHVDVISDGHKVALNKTGTPYMTKGGCGDILTGICGALLARGVNAFDAACAAAYINGKAGELAAKNYKEGMLATDMIQNIPRVI